MINPAPYPDAIGFTLSDFSIRLLVALGIGLLIGLEREYAAFRQGEKIFAGIRTFVFLALTGFSGAFVQVSLGMWVMSAVIVGVIALIGISYWITAHQGDIGGTSELAAILVLLLGAATFLGYVRESLMVTVVIFVMLSAKPRLQLMIGQITREEMFALLRFVVLALLLFPFLPDAGYGPGGIVNPKEVGWVILLTSGLGFSGYVLMRILGTHKGTLVTGMLGGLVSSTMVTWVFARKSREQAAPGSLYASAIFAASAIMIARVFLWVYLFNGHLMGQIALPVGLIFLTAAVLALYGYKRNPDDPSNRAVISPGKPLELVHAMIFGGLYVSILLLVRYAQTSFGQGGLFVTSALAGLTDVDAITITLTRMSPLDIDAAVAGTAILIATLANTLVKLCITLWAGSGPLRRYAAVGYALVLVAGVVGVWILHT